MRSPPAQPKPIHKKIHILADYFRNRVGEISPGSFEGLNGPQLCVMSQAEQIVFFNLDATAQQLVAPVAEEQIDFRPLSLIDFVNHIAGRFVFQIVAQADGIKNAQTSEPRAALLGFHAIQEVSFLQGTRLRKVETWVLFSPSNMILPTRAWGPVRTSAARSKFTTLLLAGLRF